MLALRAPCNSVLAVLAPRTQGQAPVCILVEGSLVRVHRSTGLALPTQAQLASRVKGALSSGTGRAAMVYLLAALSARREKMMFASSRPLNRSAGRHTCN